MNKTDGTLKMIKSRFMQLAGPKPFINLILSYFVTLLSLTRLALHERAAKL